eukprot:SAG11_NODE_5035_length_1684_cov_0.820189_1_plen_103_part_10
MVFDKNHATNFVRAFRSPLVAAMCFNAVDSLYGIHHSGFSSNLLEVWALRRVSALPVPAPHAPRTLPRARSQVGGEDTAIINAVSNTLTNLPGFLVPLLGVLV